MRVEWVEWVACARDIPLTYYPCISPRINHSSLHSAKKVRLNWQKNPRTRRRRRRRFLGTDKVLRINYDLQQEVLCPESKLIKKDSTEFLGSHFAIFLGFQMEIKLIICLVHSFAELSFCN